MLGIRYYKAAPTTFVMQFRGGRRQRQGSGLSFFYFAPGSTLVAVPQASTDLPFMFGETSADFQSLTVQGHLTYRVADPVRLAALLDYSLQGARYASDDPGKLAQRIAHAAQTATRAEVQARPLRAALLEADVIGQRVRAAMEQDAALRALGVEVLAFSLLAIKPVPDTARALEAEARERLLREADDALYGRRNNAVEQERRIRENELDTELAVAEKERAIEERRLQTQIEHEAKRRELVAAESDNTRALADAQAYAIEATLRPWKQMDPKSLQVLAVGSADPRSLVALAFQEIAANAAKVGNLNISPELLDRLLRPAKGLRTETR
jgi:hypothetical protein